MGTTLHGHSSACIDRQHRLVGVESLVWPAIVIVGIKVIYIGVAAAVMSSIIVNRGRYLMEDWEGRTQDKTANEDDNEAKHSKCPLHKSQVDEKDDRR